MMNKVTFNIPPNNKPTSLRSRYVKTLTSDNKNLNIGTLNLDYNEIGSNQTVYDKLNSNEVIQCKEFITVYNKMRRCKPDTTNLSYRAQTIYWDTGFANMLYEISEQAEQQGLKFYPKEIMLDALLSEIETIGGDMDLSQIFDKYGFDTIYQRSLFQQKINNQQRQAVITDFLALGDDKENLIQQLNDHLNDRYGKQKHFSLNMLLEHTQGSSKRAIKSYLMSACIDILVSQGVNPCDKHDAGLIFFYWYAPRIKQYNSTQALNRFISEFGQPTEEQMTLVYLAMTDLLSRPISENHVHIDI